MPDHLRDRGSAASGRESFTREELLAAMTLSPCHITGTHDPTHTPKYVCRFQMKDALQGVLDLLGITVDELPRRAHEWPSSSPLEAAWVNRQPITFTVDTLPGQWWSDYSEAWEAAVAARSREGKFRVYGITAGMKEPETVGYW